MIAFKGLYVEKIITTKDRPCWYWGGTLNQGGEVVEFSSDGFFFTADDARVNAAKWAAWIGAEMETKEAKG